MFDGIDVRISLLMYIVVGAWWAIASLQLARLYPHEQLGERKKKGQRRSPCNCRGVPGFTSFYGFVRNRVHSAYPSYAPSVSSTSRAETRTMPLVPGLYSCETGLKIYAALGGGGARRDLTEGNTAVQVRTKSQCTRQSRDLTL